VVYLGLVQRESDDKVSGFAHVAEQILDRVRLVLPGQRKGAIHLSPKFTLPNSRSGSVACYEPKTHISDGSGQCYNALVD